jgi:hypothetical protein
MMMMIDIQTKKEKKFPKEVGCFPFSYYKSIELKFFENKIDGVNECQYIIKMNIYIYISQFSYVASIVTNSKRD